VNVGTLTIPTAPQLARLGECLRANWPIIARHDPEFASTQKFVADALRDGRFLEAFLNRTIVPEPATKLRQNPPHRYRHENVEMARSWYFRRRETWPKNVPFPSEAEDLIAAAADIPGVPRQILREQRPVEWRIQRGRRCKSPKT
jgi:hypothetical protein